MKTSLLKPQVDLFNKQYNQIKPITNQLVNNKIALNSEAVAEPIKKPGFVMTAVLKAQKWAVSLELKSLEDLIVQQKLGIGVAKKCELKGISYESPIDLQRQLSQSRDELSRLNNRLREINLQLNGK